MNPAHFEILQSFYPKLVNSRCHTHSLFDDINIEQFACFSSKRSRLYKEFIAILDFHNIPYEIENIVRDMKGLKNPEQIVNTTVTYVIFI